MMAVLGEVMIEFAPVEADLFRCGVAGDTYNTAVMLRQLGTELCYVTALGDEQFSARIETAFAQYGLDGRAVLRLAQQQPGLYCISNDQEGERSFSYWRQHSAARQAFQNKALFLQLLNLFPKCSDIYWSGITLALMSPEVTSLWLDFLAEHQRRGGRVYFDTNYRSALWAGRDDCLLCYQQALRHCNYFLPSLDDCFAIWGGSELQTGLKLLEELALEFQPKVQICLTAKAEVFWWQGGHWQQFSLSFSEKIQDATGAGDAFSGALIAALQQDLTPAMAIPIAHTAASTVVQHKGAILPKASWPVLTQQLQALGLRPKTLSAGVCDE
jgi:2-dehydro-3-deoxygluconokinase